MRKNLRTSWYGWAKNIIAGTALIAEGTNSMTTEPLVFVAILAKQKETMLPAWLDSLSKWDYPKDRMILYVRSNNNTDDTEQILRDWCNENAKWYRHVVEDYSDLDVAVENFGVHEWNATRFKALGAIRETSINAAWQADADFYLSLIHI